MAFRVPVMHLATPPNNPLRQPEIALIKDCKQLAMLLQMFDRHENIAPMASVAKLRVKSDKLDSWSGLAVRTVCLSFCKDRGKTYSK